MEKSFFEKVGDKVLFVFLKSLLKEIDNDYSKISIINYKLRDSVKNLCDVFNYKEPLIIDIDYIIQLLLLNQDLLSQPKLEGNLVRPEIKEYSIEFDEHVTEYVRYTYRETIPTYSGSKDVAEIANYMYRNGELELDNLIDKETIDTDYNEVKVDRTTIQEL